MGSGAETAASVGNAASSAVDYGAAYSNTAVPSFAEMSMQSGPITSSTSGFSIGNASTAASGMGPTIEAGNIQEYGTANPSFLKVAMNKIGKFEDGGNQSFSGFTKNFGNNPQTWGYGYSKLSSMAKGGGMSGMQQAPILQASTNSNSENDYLRKYRRY